MVGEAPGLAKAHPLDDCDPSECYQTMMSERTELVKARREAEDTFIKTIVQLSSTFLVLIAGYTIQSQLALSGWSKFIFVMAPICLIIAIVAGLLENYFSSKAYQEQLKQLENYYTKKISQYTEPVQNTHVRISQVIAFFSFSLTMIFVAVTAILEM